MAQPHALHVRQRANKRHDHLLHLVLGPEHVLLLSLAEHVFEIHLVVDILANDADPEGIVHRFVEKVTEELNDVLVVLGLEKLDGFLFVLV